MSERPESPYVLEQKEKLKLLLEKRENLRRRLEEGHDSGMTLYNLKHDLKVVGWQIDDVRKAIRADRMRDRRAGIIWE